MRSWQALQAFRESNQPPSPVLALDVEGTRDVVSPAPGKGRVRVEIYSVAPRFFETLGIPLLAGEDFRGGLPATTL